ncbi:RNA methyltransferase [Thermodesulfovibrionales bacterium]|nr:RNA methyltransferase [Thermodesulfovibrionales bacterium]
MRHLSRCNAALKNHKPCKSNIKRGHKDKEKVWQIQARGLPNRRIPPLGDGIRVGWSRNKECIFAEEFASKKDGQQLLRQVAKKASHLIEISKQILYKLSDTETPQGIVGVISYKPIDLGEIVFKDTSLLVVCDGIQDPGNLGTIIRVSDAAGADAIIILPDTYNVFMPKTIRVTAGSLFNIPVVYSESNALLDYLDPKGIQLYIADLQARSLIYKTDLRQPVAIAFGNEAYGVSKTLKKKAKDLIKILLISRAESLNVAIAASLCLYEAARQRRYQG